MGGIFEMLASEDNNHLKKEHISWYMNVFIQV